MLGAQPGSPQPSTTIVATHYLAADIPRSGFVHGRRAEGPLQHCAPLTAEQVLAPDDLGVPSHDLRQREMAIG
jgi:hypothetical protein